MSGIKLFGHMSCVTDRRPKSAGRLMRNAGRKLSFRRCVELQEGEELPLRRCLMLATLALTSLGLTALAPAQQISLQTLVTPSTTILKDGHPVTFALHGFIEFKALAELFPYIESQTHRWKLSDAEQRSLARDLLHRGIESRVVSMVNEWPLEALITHTRD